MTRTPLSRFPSWLVTAVALAVAIRIAFGVVTWEPGWSALTWDDFTRVAIAEEWANAPFLFNGFVWLPIPVWITGFAYAIAGPWFASSPMALMAVVNTTAIIVAATVTTWSAHRLFNDTIGSLAVFLLVLFAPWGYFLSLSGLAEPLYFVAISAAVAGLVAWASSGSNWALAVGSIGVAGAAGMRYEGWWLAAAWLFVIGVDTLLILRRRPFGTVVSERLGTLMIAGAPLAVPLAWMGVNLVEKGSPLFFARESARIFSSAYGGFDHTAERIVYYPMALLRSAPFLFALEGVVAVAKRRRRTVVLLVGLFATQFVLFYVTSLPSKALGAFPERFLFAFALGLAPLIGGIPGIIRDLTPARFVRFAAVALVAVAVLVTAGRLQDRPEEWTHAPDLLALNEHLGRVSSAGPIALVAAPNTPADYTPLSVQNGDRIQLNIAAEDAVPGSKELGHVWLERDPARILRFGLHDSPTIGRFRLTGAIADEFLLPACTGCDGWTWIDESGTERPMESSPFLGFQFITDNPAAGEQTAIVKAIAPADHMRRGSVELRGLWGHGFNRGRMRIVVTLDDVIVSETDLSEPSRWRRVRFEVPPGLEGSHLSVAVVALPGIEQGWGWGSASAVLVRELVLEPA